MRARRGSIEVLNRKWLRRYRDFSEVDPADSEAPYSIWSSVLPSVDYEAFRAANLTDICRRWADYARALDPGHPVVIDGTSGQLLEASVIGRNNDEFATARTGDIFGGIPQQLRNRVNTRPRPHRRKKSAGPCALTHSPAASAYQSRPSIKPSGSASGWAGRD